MRSGEDPLVIEWTWEGFCLGDHSFAEMQRCPPYTCNAKLLGGGEADTQ